MRKITLCFGISLLLAALPAFSGEIIPPPNHPGDILVTGSRIDWKYAGETIFSAEIFAADPDFQHHFITAEKNGRMTGILLLNVKDSRRPLTLEGNILGSGEAFACEADRRDQGLQVVRHAYGPSRSRLNRAVYDRRRDWVLSVDHNPRVRILPAKSTGSSRLFSIRIEGREIVIRFRPRFFQKHRGLDFYEPWTYRVWPKPVVGWCSWFAYFRDITEENIIKTADIFAHELRAYGYEYLQIDDGYQRGQGLPELWLEPNEKFPKGLKDLASRIKSRGLKPGIWTNVSFEQMEYAKKHKEYFVSDSQGRPAWGNWIDLSIDGSQPAALQQLVGPIYRELKAMGWEYFKVDALRHLRYEGYNSFPDHFRKKGSDRVAAYRALVASIRDAIGREHFMLGCWGIRPELIGIIDGCRIGTDGYSFAGLSQYNSFNNVVWLNDPDHIELSPEEAYRSTMATSLTGSLFLLTDKPEVYRTDRVEPAKRAAPVLFTLPGQIYDVDPSRSQYIHLVDTEVSGSGPRVFDASRDPQVHLFLLEINREFESWSLLGRTGGDYPRIPFTELGLDGEEEYYVFEFWTKSLLGSFKRSFSPGPIPARFNCQLFCIRRRADRPQIIASNRHITCGGFDLESAAWNPATLSGTSRLVGGDGYILYVTEPGGYVFSEATCSLPAVVVKTQESGGLRQVHILSESDAVIDWTIRFQKTSRS